MTTALARRTYLRFEIATFPEGEAQLVLPGELSPESVSELEEWLLLVIEKRKRWARDLQTTDEGGQP